MNRFASLLERTAITVHDEPLEELTIPPASFDAIICNQVIEHLAHPAEAIAKIRDILFRSVALAAGRFPRLRAQR